MRSNHFLRPARVRLDGRLDSSSSNTSRESWSLSLAVEKTYGADGGREGMGYRMSLLQGVADSALYDCAVARRLSRVEQGALCGRKLGCRSVMTPERIETYNSCPYPSTHPSRHTEDLESGRSSLGMRDMYPRMD